MKESRSPHLAAGALDTIDRATYDDSASEHPQFITCRSIVNPRWRNRQNKRGRYHHALEHTQYFPALFPLGSSGGST